MSEQRAFRGVWIPAEIWTSTELSLQEKVMLVEIDSLQHPERGCYKSNRAFGKFFQLSPNRVSEIITGLTKKGWIKVQQVRQGKQVVERRIFMAAPLSTLAEGGRDSEGGSRKAEGGYSENRANPDRDLEGGYSENREERGSGLRGSVEGSPSLSDADAGEAPSVFDRAADLDDQGEPIEPEVGETPPQPLADHVGRKTPMTLEWEPEPAAWQRACWERGLAPDADVHQALIDFREHFVARPGRSQTPADWTRRFARWVAENLQRQAARDAQPPATGGAHATRRDRTPARRLTAAEARARDRARQEPGGAVYEGEHHALGH